MPSFLTKRRLAKRPAFGFEKPIARKDCAVPSFTLLKSATRHKVALLYPNADSLDVPAFGKRRRAKRPVFGGFILLCSIQAWK